MKAENRTVELIKTAAVVLLLISLVCLCAVYLFGFEQGSSPEFTSSMLDDLRRRTSKAAYSGYFGQSLVSPYFVGIHLSSGESRGVISGTESMEKMYSCVSEFLPALLGENGIVSSLSENEGEELRDQALAGDYIYIDYRNPLPKSLIYYMTLPENISENVTDEYISALLIFPTGEPISIRTAGVDGKITETEIYSYAAIAKGGAGNYYVYSSASLPSTLSDVYFNKGRLSSYNVKDTVSFDFAGKTSEKLDCMTVLTQAASAVSAGVTFPLISAEQNAIASVVNAFSVNYEKAAKYVDADGSVTYLEEGHNVRITDGGTVLYTVTGTPDGVFLSDFIGLYDEYSVCDYVGVSLLLISKMNINSGNAELALGGIYKNNGKIVVTFGYNCDNISVTTDGTADFIRFEYTDGMLSSAACRFVSGFTEGNYSGIVQNMTKDIFVLTSGKTGTIRLVYDFTENLKTGASWQAYISADMSGGT